MVSMDNPAFFIKDKNIKVVLPPISIENASADWKLQDIDPV